MHGSSRQENINQKQSAESLISKPNFHSLTIFNENFVAIQMNKLKCTFNKPIYVGFTVLDISKTTMYEFHFDFIKKNYNSQAKFLYRDTDAVLIGEKPINNKKRNIDEFYTSNYDVQNPYNMPLVNKAVLGVFKDENSGDIMLEFIGLRAKLYDYVAGKDYRVIKKAKGVKKCVVKRLKHEHYRNCLLNKKMQLCRRNLFKSLKHVTHTQQINKTALSPFDDKRYILPDGISTLAWGLVEFKE
ncbi:hypothetical protein NQ315_014835 [Exocentrus adspersus]|uniref:DNA-directed DNA polymerase n=1 Tax=Exocentrus adspersus TaxID=1586481 RepID=A0AAV8VKP1_9CUCU|nr:hypothetical protein NQ315_014835 [Exocentrus adspersus]